ncbi:MAG: PVC-type heme-binding CxxCH protein [Pirellula sp.]
MNTYRVSPVTPSLSAWQLRSWFIAGLCTGMCLVDSPDALGNPPATAAAVDADFREESESDPGVQMLQPGVRLTLLAQHPQLATPTGIDVDSEGNLWVIACHTHFPPKDYAGPKNDEVLVFSADGKNRRVFYDKTSTTMQLLLAKDGWVYLSQRDRVLRVRDNNGDVRGDIEETIVKLDTVADYPHNGLSGMAWNTDGGLVLSLGENFGKLWTLRGKNTPPLTGRGEGGVFTMNRDGSGLKRIARGFWNPFGLLMRDDGQLFAAENDPGSRPPCRLLHVVEGADYGFQYVYGSAPVHPFVAWNGELRGTLGMVHPCSEGPCSVVELGGGVMIPSWSNHCIDFFPLRWSGATLTSERIELLHGSDFFRPVCMVRANENTYYFTDWVSPSYQVHGMGRLWKLEIDPAQATWLQPQRDPAPPAAELANALRSGQKTLPLQELLSMARSEDRFLADAALSAMARSSRNWADSQLVSMPTADKVWGLVALRRNGLNDPKWVRLCWNDSNPELRLECLRWIADGELKEFLPRVEALLADPKLEYRLFEASIATINTLKGTPEAGVTDPATLVQRLMQPTTSPSVRAYILRLLPANHEKLTVQQLVQWYRSGHPLLMLETIRTLAMQRRTEAQEVLLQIAKHPKTAESLRAEALAGLLGTEDPKQRETIEQILKGDAPAIAKEALRALRHPTLKWKDPATPVALRGTHPQWSELIDAVDSPMLLASRMADNASVEEWLDRLQKLPGEPDPQAGRRVFFSAATAACSQCHRHGGRGNVVGPDLSLIHQQGSYRDILQSILEPNRNVAPQYYSTLLELADGSTFTGILLRSSSNEVYRNAVGDEVTFQKADIEERRELRSSMMPAGLAHQMTDVELRDLMAFLTKPAASSP